MINATVGRVLDVGEGGRQVAFTHPQVGQLTINTGIDNVSWGYGLNTANFPTYGGEVIQILSCFVEDLSVGGTLRSYEDLDAVYGFFLQYMRVASAGGARNETPLTFEYPERGWTFQIIVTQLPSYRRALDVIAPEWKIQAFIVDDTGDVEDLSKLIVQEAQIKAATGSDDPNFDQNFGLLGRIRYYDHNPFSDPWATDDPSKYGQNRFAAIQAAEDTFTKMLPAYLSGDFNAIFGNLGSRPTFGQGVTGRAGTQQQDSAQSEKDGQTAVTKASHGKSKK